jgi:hypothetical protein
MWPVSLSDVTIGNQKLLTSREVLNVRKPPIYKGNSERLKVVRTDEIPICLWLFGIGPERPTLNNKRF